MGGTIFETYQAQGIQSVGSGDSDGRVFVAVDNGAVGLGIISHILYFTGQDTSVCQASRTTDGSAATSPAMWSRGRIPIPPA